MKIHIPTAVCIGCLEAVSGKIRSVDPEASVVISENDRILVVETSLTAQHILDIGATTPHTLVIVGDTSLSTPSHGFHGDVGNEAEPIGSVGHNHHEGHGVGIGPETFLDPYTRSLLLAEDDPITIAVARVDRLADLSRSVCSLDGRAQVLFIAELDQLITEFGEGEVAKRIPTRPLSEVSKAPAYDGYRRLCAGPVLDVLTAAAFVAGDDGNLLVQYVDAIEETILQVAFWIEAALAVNDIEAYKFADLSNEIAAETRSVAVRALLPGSTVTLPPPPAEILAQAAEALDFRHVIGEIANGWRDLERNPIHRWARYTGAQTFNYALGSISPRQASVGECIHLTPQKGKHFKLGVERIQALFSGPGGQISETFKSFNESEATVDIPVGAPALSDVRFARVPTDAERTEVTNLLHDWSERFVGDWVGSRLEAFQHHQIPVVSVLSPATLPIELTISVYMPPSIQEVYLIDRDSPDSNGPEADMPAGLTWRGFAVLSETRVRITMGDETLGEALPINGDLPLPADTDFETLSITLIDRFGERSVLVKDMLPKDVFIPIPKRTKQLTLELATLSGQKKETAVEIGPVDGWNKGWKPSRYETLRVSCGPDAPKETVWLDITANAARVKFLHTRIALGAGQRSVDIAFQALNPGDPGESVEITVSAKPTASHEFEGAIFNVYIVPEGGRWSTRGKTKGDTLAVHAALLDDGNVLFFNPRGEDGFKRRSANDLDHMEIGLFDPESGNVSLAPSPMNPLRNLFCAGHAHTPDGRLLVAGGHIISPAEWLPWHWGKHHLRRGSNGRFVYLYDQRRSAQKGERWLRMPQMKHDRWYPTVTCMPDGMMLITSGSSAALLPFHDFGAMVQQRSAKPHEKIANMAPTYKVAREYEFFNPRTNRIVQPPKGRERLLEDKNLATYPFVFVLPQGKTLYCGGMVMAIDRTQVHLYSYDGKNAELVHARTTFLYHRSIRTFPLYGTAVLLTVGYGHPTARVLVLGGGDERDRRPKRDRELYKSMPATDTAELIEFDPSQVIGRQPGLVSPWRLRMNARRFMSDAVLLPDGTVFVCGGAEQGYANGNSGDVRQAELYEPESQGAGRFRQMASSLSERRYHSTALLLPDATVLSAGSTRGFPPEEIKLNRDLDIWEPPYLWRGKRPIIHVMGSLGYGRETIILLNQEPLIEQVVLVRLGSVTHANNMDQRCVNLEITSRSTSQDYFPHLTVRGPEDGTVAPPGSYMLFVISAAGVPSKGQIGRLK